MSKLETPPTDYCLTLTFIRSSKLYFTFYYHTGATSDYLRADYKQKKHRHAAQKILKVHYPAIWKRYPEWIHSREEKWHDLHQRRRKLWAAEAHWGYGKYKKRDWNRGVGISLETNYLT